MEHNMHDIVSDLHDYITKTQRMIYAAEVGCGRKPCENCLYNNLCEAIFELEIQSDFILNPEDYSGHDEV